MESPFHPKNSVHNALFALDFGPAFATQDPQYDPDSHYYADHHPAYPAKP